MGISMLYKYGTNLDNKAEIAVGFGFGHNWAYEQGFVYALFNSPFIFENDYME